MDRMEERESAQQQLRHLKEEAEDLQYALKVLLETGTIIPPELDERIQDAMDGTNLYDIDDDNLFPVCLNVFLAIYDSLYNDLEESRRQLGYWSIYIQKGDGMAGREEDMREWCSSVNFKPTWLILSISSERIGFNRNHVKPISDMKVNVKRDLYKMVRQSDCVLEWT